MNIIRTKMNGTPGMKLGTLCHYVYHHIMQQFRNKSTNQKIDAFPEIALRAQKSPQF